MPERRFPSPWTVEETDAEPLPGAPVALPQLLPFRPVKLLPSGVIGGCVMSAKVLELPARVRCDRAARELRESVIGVLKEIRRHCGDTAFHRAARDLVASVAATVAQVEGRQRMLDVLDLIDRATEA